MRLRPLSICLLLLCITGLATARQQPPSTPTFPAINPAQARADGVLGGLDGPGIGISYHSSSGKLWAASENGTLITWGPDAVLGIRTGDSATPSNPGKETSIVTFASGFDLLATASPDGKIFLWNQKTGQSVQTLTSDTPVRAMVLLDAGKTLATVGDSGFVQIWDTATGKVGPKWQASDDWLLAVAISPDGKTLATGGLDGKLRTWEMKDGKKGIEAIAQPPAQPKQPVNRPAPISSIVFAPDGKSILAGSQDGSIYQLASDGKLTRTLTGHGSTVTTLLIHPAGQLLVSASKDRTLRLWNPGTGQPIKTLEGHSSWIQSATFVAQGTRLASVSADHTVRLWDLTEPIKK